MKCRGRDCRDHELSTIAFVKRGLEMKAGRKVKMKRISGFERGKTVHYRFALPNS